MGKKKVILLVGVAFVLAAMLACDSSGGGGGAVTTATGYTQADLAGVWVVSGIDSNKMTFKFDEQGQMVWWNDGWTVSSGFIEKIIVDANGQLSGKVVRKMTATISQAFVFNAISFQAPNLMTGTFTRYRYQAALGKYGIESFKVRITR